MEKEIWKDILGYEELYSISNTGKVFMKGRYKKNGSKTNYIKPMYIKSNNNGISKHSFVRISQKKIYIHRLVAQAFLGLNINDSKSYVCHKDDNPLNNNVDNLFIGTCKDNHTDMVNKGRMAVNDMLPQTRLNSDIIQFIKDSKGKVNQIKLSKMFNVNQSHISRIHNNIARNYA